MNGARSARGFFLKNIVCLGIRSAGSAQPMGNPVPFDLKITLTMARNTSAKSIYGPIAARFDTALSG
jgi:hypothetical protein